MRIALLAAGAATMILGGCGGSSTGQAKKAEANASLNMVMASAGPASMGIPAAVTNKDQALQIMKVRHDGMEALGKAMKTLHRSLDASPPDLATIRAQTSAMAVAGTKIPSLFPPGTGPDVAKTRAKPDIWKQQDLFLKRAKEYLAAAQALDAAAKAGDVKAVMARHDDVDRACNACHKPFRAPEH